jgi:hypothetical protein
MTQIVFHVSSSWLCYDADYVTLSDRIIDESERIWKEVIMSNLRYYPNICLEGLMETKKNLSQDSCVLAEIWTKHYCYSTPPCTTCCHLLI